MFAIQGIRDLSSTIPSRIPPSSSYSSTTSHQALGASHPCYVIPFSVPSHSPTPPASHFLQLSASRPFPPPDFPHHPPPPFLTPLPSFFPLHNPHPHPRPFPRIQNSRIVSRQLSRQSRSGQHQRSDRRRRCRVTLDGRGGVLDLSSFEFGRCGERRGGMSCSEL